MFQCDNLLNIDLFSLLRFRSIIWLLVVFYNRGKIYLRLKIGCIQHYQFFRGKMSWAIKNSPSYFNSLSFVLTSHQNILIGTHDLTLIRNEIRSNAKYFTEKLSKLYHPSPPKKTSYDVALSNRDYKIQAKFCLLDIAEYIWSWVFK